jgi:outer membrane protein OmpA-like peptidoglycan-associated protein
LQKVLFICVMKQMYFITFLLCLTCKSLAQTPPTIQWASRLLGFSSEYSESSNKNPYSAKQVLGKPNKMPATGFSPVAWSPNAEDRSVSEWVKVGFKTPMAIRQIAVAENFGAGSITHIYMYDTENNEYIAYTDSTFRVVQNPPPARMLRITIPLTTYKIAAIKVLLNPIRIRGRNQIDAIGISDSEIPIDANINLPIPNNNPQETIMAVSTERLSDAVNSKYNEIMPVISADGKTLFFDRQMHPDNTVGEFVNDDIWFAEINEDQTWKPAQRLPKPLNNENHNYVCSISPDGNTMLVANDYNFEANSNKTNGGASITRKNIDGTWQNPEKLIIENYYNLSINAEFYLAHNQKILLMSIEREDSQGGRDIYISFFRFDTKTWSIPKNLGATVNSAGTELTPFLAADNETLYFSSNGFSGYGETDMFFCKRLDDSWTNWTEPVNLGKPFNSTDWDAAYSLDAQGEYAYYISYQNSTKDADIFRAKLPTSIKPKPVKTIDLALNSLSLGQTIRLQHIIFEQGTAILLDSSVEELSALIRLLNENATMEIELSGHTDIEGSPIENMKLSQERVKSIKNYLVKQGINPARIRTRAFGSQQPITRNRDENSKQLNRRVELKVLKF